MPLSPLAENMDPPQPRAAETTPGRALERLMEGNRRFAANRAEAKDYTAERIAQAQRQQPFAAVLTCADSRVSPELAFDQGPGRVFAIRLAGNFLNTDGLASLEYGVGVLDIPLVLVLGHSHCGAVNAAIQAQEPGAPLLPGALPELVRSITPAVEAAKALAPDDMLDEASRQNALIARARIEAATPLMSDKAASGAVKVAAGMFDLSTGEVELLEH
jgi:carbonic anhydrase